ncbi:MAG TPA: alcohol dehydrogenase catalytic domain-containing protein [Solirubrobacterales bacterium]|nr:alcohol dehydrogenase catalytic domain-containing protein [Solirubrobacterales bacterium]
MVRFHEFGGPEVLAYEEVPTPSPGPGEVLVEARAIGVNGVDTTIRRGRLPVDRPLPLIPGLEMAGTIAALGDGVEGRRVGDPVLPSFQMWCGTCRACLEGRQNHCAAVAQFSVPPWQGTYAEYLVAPSRFLMRLPESLSFEEAATLQVTFVTAFHAVRSSSGAVEGDTILVNSAAGGIGDAAVQAAGHLRMKVIAAAGSAARLARIDSPAVVAKVDYGSEDLTAAVLDLTGGEGVDAVIDCAGGEVLAQSIGCLRRGGRLVALGAHGGDRVELPLWDLVLRSRALVGSARGTARDIARVVELAGEGALRPRVDGVYPLARAAAAHERMESRSTLGKLALVP